MPTRIAVAGAAGRMGQRILALAAADQRFQTVAALEAAGSPRCGADAGEVAGAGRIGLPIVDRLPNEFDVLVDFSSPPGTQQWLSVCLERGKPMVIGVTGHDTEQLAKIDAAARRIAVLRAPNMSVGVNVLLRAVEQLAGLLADGYDCEIIEAHHRFKVDAPSGTAAALADAVGRGRALGRAELVHGRSGRPGPRPPTEIGMHAVRGGDVIGEHEVRFMALGEAVAVRHTASSRDTFALGALRAADWIVDRPAGRYSMSDVLFGPTG